MLTADVHSQSARGYEVGQQVYAVFPASASQALLLDAAEVELVQMVDAERI